MSKQSDREEQATSDRELLGEGGWQPMATAPMDGTCFLAWFQKHKLDDDGDATDEVVGGAQALISFSGGSWNEPEWLGAHGAYFFEDWCFADEPVLWHPLPADPAAPTQEPQS